MRANFWDLVRQRPRIFRVVLGLFFHSESLISQPNRQNPWTRKAERPQESKADCKRKEARQSEKERRVRAVRVFRIPGLDEELKKRIDATEVLPDAPSTDFIATHHGLKGN